MNVCATEAIEVYSQPAGSAVDAPESRRLILFVIPDGLGHENGSRAARLTRGS